MRRVRAGADPDAATRLVTLPADWEDDAAAALAQLAPGRAGVSLAQAATGWIAALSRDEPGNDDLADSLASLLLHRAAAPNQAVWQQSRTDAASFSLNLAAFVESAAGFEVEGFVAAIGSLAEALRRLAGSSGRSGRILLGNLDACLAKLGLEYDSDAARDAAACLMAIATASAHPDRLPRQGAGTLPASCVIPGLASAARAAWARTSAQASRHGSGLFPDAGGVETGLSSPCPADALLGFEACGIAPIFSPLRPDGRLAASTLARLAARGMGPEAAFAASLAGETVLRTADFASVRAMQRAIGPFIDQGLGIDQTSGVDQKPAAPPQNAVAATLLPTPARRELPSRHGGFTQKATVGNHRLYLRTGEYADGSLGEISISPVRDGPAQRGLMDAFSHAVSIGLQHGVPLEAFVEAFAYTRFGPNGAVEGDASISTATSSLDYAFRTLAQAYLGQALPDASPQPHEPAEVLLPLDLPSADDIAGRPGAKPARPGIRQRHGLRLVG